MAQPLNLKAWLGYQQDRTDLGKRLRPQKIRISRPSCHSTKKTVIFDSYDFCVQHPPRRDYRTNQSGSLIYGCTANTWLGDKTICDYYISYDYITWGATRDTDNSMSSPVCPKNGRWVKLREIWVLSFTWCQGYGYYGPVLVWRDVIYILSPRLSLPFSEI